MKIQVMATTLLAIGMMLLIGSIVWPWMASPKSAWSEEQAQEYIEASAKFHGDSFNNKISAADLKASQDAFAARREQLDRAVNRHQSLPKWLRVVGLAMCAIGVITLLSQRNRSD